MKKPIYLRLLALTFLTLLLPACVKDNTPPPTPLKSNIPMRFTPKTLWSDHATNGANGQFLSLAPAVSKTIILTAGNDGEVAAIDRLSGDTRWSVDLDKAFTSPPAINATTAFIGTLKGELIAINLTNGKIRWQANLTSSLFAKPAISGNTVVVHVHNDDIMAFNAKTGKVLWHNIGTASQLILQGDSAPAIHQKTVYIGLSTGFLEALNLATGQLKWNRPVSLPTGASEVANIIDISGQPAVAAPFIYAVSYQGNVASLNLDDGKPLWQKPLSSFKPIALTQDKLFVTSFDSKVYALDRDTGKILWVQNKLAYRFLSAPAVIGKYIVVGDYAGYLHFLSIQDGHLSSRIKLSRSGIRAKPIVYGKNIYINTNNGYVIAVSIG